MSKKIEEGDKIPNFSVLVSEDSSIEPKDLLGKKWVIYFYPKDNTPGCTAESKDFASLYSKFKQLNVDILGVSKDSIKSHNNFRNKYDLPFLLGSDPEMEMCKAFNVWVEKSMYGKKYMGIERSTFLVDAHGKILKCWRKVSVSDHAEKVLNEVKK